MTDTHIIGLDFGTESARGVLVEIATGRQHAQAAHPYRHGVMTRTLPSGEKLPTGFALQKAGDYLNAAVDLLERLGRGRAIAAIGIAFTASSPLPALADMTPLSDLYPGDPHAYVKMWKHAAAQPHADLLSTKFSDSLRNVGGRLSGEWMLPKAAELASDAPELWRRTERFIEAGDWLVWNLTGREVRSRDFASYKAQFTPEAGYPEHVVDGLKSRVSWPADVGAAAGELTDDWRHRTRIRGSAVVAVAIIDSHANLQSTGPRQSHAIIGALGTSAGFLIVDTIDRPLPVGLEAAAFGAAQPGVWCCEAGQAAFGDLLAWYVRTFPRSQEITASFASYNSEAALIRPGESGLLALDWFGGNRVPYRDSSLSGLLVGLCLDTSAAAIYRSLVESLCFGTRSIIDRAIGSGIAVDQVVLTSGLSHSNPFVVQTMADVLDRVVEVPSIENATAVGAAVHGAVCSRTVADFSEGNNRFGAKGSISYSPTSGCQGIYRALYDRYLELTADESVRLAMQRLKQTRLSVTSSE